ncbi:dolichyl-phosphate beta-D-mannosyltransferase [Sporobolomyces koalae]|uniref:dolichyl-phosphate beta-D-mannosyltransferase n=1 Tax=Sporobolomyces koalae TaxID=500713 RepID=UPI00316C6DDC
MRPRPQPPVSPVKRKKNKMGSSLRPKQPRVLASPTAQLVAFVSSLLVSLVLFRSPATLYSPTESRQYSPPPQPPSRSISNSIVVPAYHERANIRPLVEAVFGALRERDHTEIVIVDDNSQDGTSAEVETLQSEGYQVELLVRTHEKGLSSAVLRGFELARGHKLVVMDADLQHPASAIQPMFDALSPSSPLALGTRYGEGVSMSQGWPLHRRIISWGARTLARPLTSASDPMTGFFGIMKDHLLACQPINSSGFKIALELLLKTPRVPIRDVPYSFGIRTIGSSKLSSKVMLKYVGQLITLYVWSWGIWFHLLVALGLTAGLNVADAGWRQRKRVKSRSMEYPLGGYHPDGGKAPLVTRQGGLFGRSKVVETKRFL